MHAVSVVVPTYNRSTLLAATLESILRQTRPPAEIIVLDDGSTDDTAEVVRRMPAMVQYHHQQNTGICAARNAGVSFAASPYIAFCDHDDLWREDKLELQMELHDAHPEIHYSFTNYVTVMDGTWSQKTKFDEAPHGFFDFPTRDSGRSLICRESLYKKLLHFQPIFPSTTVMTKELYQSMGGANEKFGRNPAEDWDLTLRCVHKPPVGIVGEPVVSIRKHASNYSGDTLRNALGAVEMLEHALLTHDISDDIRSSVRKRAADKRLEGVNAAFARGDMMLCRRLLAELPDDRISRAVRLKLLISCCPTPIARAIHSLVWT